MDRALLLLEIVKGCIVRESSVSHSGLALPWKWEWERLGAPNLEVLAAALPVRIPTAGIVTGGWALVDHIPGLSVMVDRDRIEPRGLNVLRAPRMHGITLVGDVVTTGRSMRAAEITLDAHGIAVRGRVCVLDRRAEFGISQNLKIVSLFTSADLEVGS